ncbi:MAG: response regulator [Phycisphaerae bacterium]|jgi:DNA-binding NarL/FixJ family response regulator
MHPYPGLPALIVDDEPSTRFLLREVLESLGMVVTEAVDGADAIHKSLLSRYTLTTMDILMPNVNGLDAIHALRMVDPTCRIVVVTSCTEPDLPQALRDLDVPLLVRKPIRVDTLHTAIHQALGSAASPAHLTPWGQSESRPFNE